MIMDGLQAWMLAVNITALIIITCITITGLILSIRRNGSLEERLIEASHLVEEKLKEQVKAEKRLNRKLKKIEQVSEGVEFKLSLAGQMVKQRSGGDNELLSSKGNGFLSDVRSMTDKGCTTQEIAENLDRPRAEVEMIQKFFRKLTPLSENEQGCSKDDADQEMQ